MGLKYIIVIIDTFSRYLELFPKHDISAIAVAAALWRHTCRFTAPLENVTDYGSQFVNQMLAHFHDITGIKHHMTIPYSKEENGIVERANKEVNRHIRNILFDKGKFQNWSKMLCMTEKLLNSSIKQPLGVSPNALIFGNAFHMDTSLLGIIDQDISDSTPRSVRDYVDTLIERQSRLIDAAIQSQNETNDANLSRRYSHYPRRPKLRQQVFSGDDNSVIETTDPIPVSHIIINSCSISGSRHLCG